MTNDHPDGPNSSLEALEARLEQGRQNAGLDPKPSNKAASVAMARGFKIAIEFLISVCVGALLGFWLGSLANQKIIGLMLGIVIGFLAGIRTLYRTGMLEVSAQAEEQESVDNGRDDE